MFPVFPFPLVKDLEKRKDPTKPRVKAVDKGNGSKSTSPEGQILSCLPHYGCGWLDGRQYTHSSLSHQQRCTSCYENGLWLFSPHLPNDCQRMDGGPSIQSLQPTKHTQEAHPVIFLAVSVASSL